MMVRNTAALLSLCCLMAACGSSEQDELQQWITE